MLSLHNPGDFFKNSIWSDHGILLLGGEFWQKGSLSLAPANSITITPIATPAHSRLLQFHEQVKSFFNLSMLLPYLKRHSSSSRQDSAQVSPRIPCAFFYQSNCHTALRQLTDSSALPSISSSSERMVGFLCLWCQSAWQQINLKLDEKDSQNFENTPAVAFNVWGKWFFSLCSLIIALQTSVDNTHL